MSNGNYFAPYVSPNIVLVPTNSHDSSIPNTGQAILPPCNLPCCDISAAQATAGFPDTTHFTNSNNLNYFDAYNNYNVGHVNNVNTTEELNANLLPPCSHYAFIENTTNNALVNIQQPTFQDYSWIYTHSGCYTDNPINNNMYAAPSTNTLKIKLKEKNENDTKVIDYFSSFFEETNDKCSRKNTGHVNPQNKEEKLCKTDNINKISREKNKGANVKIGENSNVSTKSTPRDKKEKMCKPTTKNNRKNANTKTKNSTISKLKSKVTKPKKDLKYLWKRHRAMLKNKIKEEIEESKDMKTELHAQWKAILRSEYSTFVNNFYRSALISKDKMKSVIANNKLKLNKNSNSDFKNKQSIPNNSASSSGNTKFTQVNVDNSIERTNSLKDPQTAPKRVYSRKHYENRDLRTLLSNKRNQNICYEPKRRMPKRPRERDNLVITVNQDIETDTPKTVAMEPKPKNKCKKIKLVINVVCNDSDSEEDSDETDNDHSALLNEDLSFLDDFNVDDIVDSLNCDDLLHDNKISTKTCANENISNNAHKYEATDKGLNELCLNQPVKMNTKEPCELASTKENCNVVCSSSAIISENERNDVIGSSLDTDYSLEVQNITKTALSDVNVKLEKVDLEQTCDNFLTGKNNPDQRLLTENSNKENSKEVYMCDSSILREINNIKNEFIAQIDEDQHMDTIGIESADQPIKHKTAVYILTDNGTNIKCGNTNTVNVCDNEKSLGQQRTTVTNMTDINTGIKTESSKIKATPVKIIVSKQTKENKVETRGLIEIKSEDEPIVISDDNDDSSDCVINIRDMANMEIQEQENINSGNENINKPSENTDVLETIKKETTEHTNEENTKHENKLLVTSDETVKSEEDIKLQVPNINSHVMVQEAKVGTSKDNEVTKEAVISKADEEPSVSRKNPVSIVSNNIPNFKEIAKTQDKQFRNMTSSDQEFVDRLEKRMFDFVDTRYKIMSIIHGGKFSKIFKCTNSIGENFALKVLNSGSDLRMKGTIKEKMLMKLQKYIPREQLNIVYLLNSFEMTGYWCFIMEYYPKNLQQALLENKKSFHINLVQVLANQLVAAVTVLTNNYIMHTDIKPQHILLNSNNGKLKLCGFDDANYTHYLHIKPNTGTVNYRAPEIILGFITDYRIDVWSTALVIYEMATGKKLFPGTFNNDILFKQMCTLGEISDDMKERSTYSHVHFGYGKFMRIMDSCNRKKMIPYFYKSGRLYGTLLTSYRQDWQCFATKQEVFEDKAKLMRLFQLLEQMLVLDPRYRLPINFVSVSEFLQDDYS